MPCADKNYKRKIDRLRKAVRYHTEPGFAEAEKERQRKIYEANREKIIARVVARREELRKAKAAGKK